jgi:hypothetical protein
VAFRLVARTVKERTIKAKRIKPTRKDLAKASLAKLTTDNIVVAKNTKQMPSGINSPRKAKLLLRLHSLSIAKPKRAKLSTGSTPRSIGVDTLT